MLYPVGQITTPVLLTMGYHIHLVSRWGFWTPRKDLPWLENADIIDYPAVIVNREFKLFFIFFIASVCALLWLVLLVILYICVIAQ